MWVNTWLSGMIYARFRFQLCRTAADKVNAGGEKFFKTNGRPGKVFQGIKFWQTKRHPPTLWRGWSLCCWLVGLRNKDEGQSGWLTIVFLRLCLKGETLKAENKKIKVFNTKSSLNVQLVSIAWRSLFFVWFISILYNNNTHISRTDVVLWQFIFAVATFNLSATRAFLQLSHVLNFWQFFFFQNGFDLLHFLCLQHYNISLF